MTRRLLALAATTALAGSLFGGVPSASACQPDSPCPQTPTCELLPKTCIRPF